METKIQFLGTSDSQGVPRMLCSCAVCKSTDNKRSRPSVFIHTSRKILVDASPDFRQQFIDGDLCIPDILCITHAHNDHIAGLGDLADLCFWHESKLTIISPPDVIDILKQRYPYLTPKRNIFFTPLHQMDVDGVHISFHRVNHGNNGYSYGIRFSNQTSSWAYVSDVINMTTEQMVPFYHLSLLILGASYLDESNYPFQYKRSIYDVREALLLREKLQPEKLILTHMSHNIDITKNILPEGVWFGKDGMCIML
ncbi:MBL fold metallo-hydrolase [Shimazuella sp. AN120528]|uniref:MBL fold metallo-hydrolase n=1 Tax=Shimazuella soli TaxID=1892854 RepID=UPI001F0E0C83|nr:MBL fold metallo-hydrolase [Shimazuella soli]MCH5586657.1 MBL fold metallo-hydrolase [Shimazuella soli]